MMRSVLKMRQHDSQSIRGKMFYTMEISLFERSWIIKLATSMGIFMRDRSSITVHLTATFAVGVFAAWSFLENNFRCLSQNF